MARTTLTASNIQDALGNKLTGTLEVMPTDGDDRPIPSTSGESGGGPIVWKPAILDIAEGAIPENTTVASTLVTRPANVNYRITVKDSTGIPVLVFSGVQSPANGDPINLDTWTPNVPAQAVAMIGIKGLDAYQVAVENGFAGSPSEWLASLVGQPFPLGSAVAQVGLNPGDTEYVEADIDADGYLARGLKSDGTNVLPVIETDSITAAEVVTDKVTTQSLRFNGAGIVDADMDGAGYIARALFEDGTSGMAKGVCWNDFEVQGKLKLLPRPAAMYDLNIILVVGQSLAEGFRSTVTPDGSDVLSTSQPFANVCLNPGPRGGRNNSGNLGSGMDNVAIDPATLTSLIPLVENANQLLGDDDVTWQCGETVSSGMANQAAYLLMQRGVKARFAVAVSAMGGSACQYIAPGTVVYENALTMITHIKDLAGGLSVGVVALVLIHGENDDFLNNTSYAPDIRNLKANYNADIAAITGQTRQAPMLIWLPSTWAQSGTRATPIVVPQMIALGKVYPDEFYVVASQYPFTHAPQDGLHLIAASEQWGGEKLGEALAAVLMRSDSVGLRCISAVLQGKTIIANFETAHGPLVLDSSGAQVTDPGSYGFEFDDGSGSPPTIATAEVVPGSNSVKITLSAVPTGTSPVLRAAWTGTLSASGGPTTGPRSVLRDSDPTPSLNGHPNLYNWLQPFSLAL